MTSFVRDKSNASIYTIGQNEIPIYVGEHRIVPGEIDMSMNFTTPMNFSVLLIDRAPTTLILVAK